MILGNVTISRANNNMGDDYINISIKDEASGNCVVEVKMRLEEFAEALTGLAHSTCEIKRVISEDKVRVLGKERVTEQFQCSRVWDKEEQEKIVDKHFEEVKNNSDYKWYLLSKGLGTQQKGDVHRYVVYRFKGE